MMNFKTDDLKFYLWSGRGFGIQGKNTSDKIKLKFELTLTLVTDASDKEASEKLENTQPAEMNEKMSKFYENYKIPEEEKSDL